MTCTISMRFAGSVLSQAVDLLRSIIDRTEALPGCKRCSVSHDAVDAQRVRYDGVWDSEAAFRRHVQSEDFRRVLTAMDMSCEEPQVTVGTLSGRIGIAYLQSIRALHDVKGNDRVDPIVGG